MFEINQNHEFYHLTCMIKEGMRASIETSMESAEQVKFPDPATDGLFGYIHHFSIGDSLSHTE